MAVQTKTVLPMIRQIFSELRQMSPNSKIKDSLIVQTVFNECKKYKTTDLQVCKASQETKFLAQTYLCYLQSSRKFAAINKDYKGKGERSTEEIANMVGFKLPHDPKP